MYSSLVRKVKKVKKVVYVDPFATKYISKDEEGGDLIKVLQRVHNKERGISTNSRRVNIQSGSASNVEKSVGNKPKPLPLNGLRKKKVTNNKKQKEKYIPGVSVEFEISSVSSEEEPPTSK